MLGLNLYFIYFYPTFHQLALLTIYYDTINVVSYIKEMTMAKGKDVQKSAKTAATKTLKEKREDKKAKKAARG